MKFVQRPQYNDEAALDAVAGNHLLKGQPYIAVAAPALKAGYAQYLAENGNVRAIAKITLPDTAAKHLRRLYSSPPSALAHIKTMRAESAPGTCPMCGSLHSGTLDHFMDKQNHPAFAVFSPNLVPACKCNSVRLPDLTGQNAGERLLHPYFDHVLSQRIVAARYTDLGFVPKIETRVILDPADPDFAAAEFHHRCVVQKTSIVGYLRIRWNNLLRAPSLIVHDLQLNPTSRGELIAAIEGELDRTDEVRGSKNNWDSIMLCGLLEDTVIDWLFDRFSVPGSPPDAPLL